MRRRSVKAWKRGSVEAWTLCALLLMLAGPAAALPPSTWYIDPAASL